MPVKRPLAAPNNPPNPTAPPIAENEYSILKLEITRTSQTKILNISTSHLFTCFSILLVLLV